MISLTELAAKIAKYPIAFYALNAPIGARKDRPSLRQLVDLVVNQSGAYYTAYLKL